MIFKQFMEEEGERAAREMQDQFSNAVDESGVRQAYSEKFGTLYDDVDSPIVVPHPHLGMQR